MGLDYVQIGLLTLTFQVTASLLQPAIGMYTDKRPLPYSLPVGMGLELDRPASSSGLHMPTGCCWSARPSWGWARRSSIPNSSRVARLASGGRHGLAQSLFQVGGNAGSAIGPLLAAFIVLPRGQWSVEPVRHRLAGRDRDPDAGRASGTASTAGPMPARRRRAAPCPSTGAPR